MKKSCMLFARALWLALVCLVTSVQASEIIFRPAPGLNNGSDTGTATAGKDASANADGTNLGALDGLYALPVSTCNTATTKAWIRFDVSTLPSDVTHVYAGFTHTPHTTYCLSNCNADFYFYPVTSEWGEMSVSLAASPPRGAPAFGPINITFPNDFGTREYEITEMYRQWKNSPSTNFGFEISSPTTGCDNAAVGFMAYSSDSTTESQRPFLRIVTADAPPAAAAVPTLSEIGLGLMTLALAVVVWLRRRSR